MENDRRVRVRERDGVRYEGRGATQRMKSDRCERKERWGERNRMA